MIIYDMYFLYVRQHVYMYNMYIYIYHIYIFPSTWDDHNLT